MTSPATNAIGVHPKAVKIPTAKVDCDDRDMASPATNGIGVHPKAAKITTAKVDCDD